ncbi:MAG: N-acetylmuramoyl-L-alanine amidase [Rhodobacterales bacterium]|nr:N-acetylmuramoyl-L-alanine amidase [Rhodobacterales bacterium]
MGSFALPRRRGAQLRTVDHPSPNRGLRRDGARPDIVVLHYTAMQSTADALDRLTDPVAEVSAHYLVSEQGTVFALVPEDLRAWHAGAGVWAGVSDINSRSIGIELANSGSAPYPNPQMTALETLLASILHRHPVPPARVIAHSDMAPARKSDPGPRFDWRRLALAGLSVWPDLTPPSSLPDGGVPGAFRAALTTFGYGSAVPDDLLLRAFRLRFRPWADSPLDATDVALAWNLARRFPVDQSASQA